MQHRFVLDDMNCGHCAARIAKANHAVDPEAEIATDPAARIVAVNGVEDRIVYAEAIVRAGYTPAEQSASRGADYQGVPMATTSKYFELAQAKSDGLLKVGRAAEASGVSPKMIRHHESIDLLPAADRTTAGYRIYRASDVHRLRFVRRARDLSFTMKEVSSLLALWQDRGRASADVERLAAQHMKLLDGKIREVQSMRDTLTQRAGHGHVDARPDCPILEVLAVPAATRVDGRREAGSSLQFRRGDSIP